MLSMIASTPLVYFTATKVQDNIRTSDKVSIPNKETVQSQKEYDLAIVLKNKINKGEINISGSELQGNTIVLYSPEFGDIIESYSFSDVIESYIPQVEIRQVKKKN